MQNVHKKKLDMPNETEQRIPFVTVLTLYFVVGNAEIKKKLQIMSLPASKIRVQYSV